MTHPGVIAAGHRLTAEAGARVLRDGGNAVDAAIAAVAMACVCEPVLCSPGGGSFAMVRDSADESVTLLDAFAHTPRRRADLPAESVRTVHADFGTTHQEFRIGPGTTAAPGLFDGLAALAAQYGTEPIAHLVTDAVRAARDGVEITPFQHDLFDVVRAITTATPSARELYLIDGHLMPVGATLRNPGLADALELLARDGFAGSDVGAAALEQQQRGHLTPDDIASFTVIERTPLEVRVNNDRVLLNPPPAVGGALIAHTLRQLATTSWVELARAINATGALLRESNGDLDLLAALAGSPVRQRGTTHISVVDADGMACAVTTSNGEGNGEIVDGFGFMLNNVLGEDDVNPLGDEWPVDTRLSSMMCPTLIEHHDGRITAMGSGGSSRIRSAISQVAARLCLDNSSLRTAVDAPRMHADGRHLDVEPIDDPTVLDELLRTFPDHRLWQAPALYFGGVHAVRLESDGSFVGVGDQRRDGEAIVVPD